MSLGEALGMDTSPGSPLLHFPYSSIVLGLLPKARCGFVSCYVCEQLKEPRWAENTSGEGSMVSAAPTAVQVLNLICEASWIMVSLMPEELTLPRPKSRVGGMAISCWIAVAVVVGEHCFWEIGMYGSCSKLNKGLNSPSLHPEGLKATSLTKGDDWWMNECIIRVNS